MDHFEYRDGELCCQGVKVSEIAAEFGTPLYVYSRETLELHYDRLASAFAELKPLICFSVKCCSNLRVLRALSERGAGMDVVSGGELHRARLAGVGPERIVFAGVGKTDEEIREALAGSGGPIRLFNIESEPEYEVVASAARTMGVTAAAALRVNPDVQAGGHAYISTGHKASKFGVSIPHAYELLRKFNHEKHLKLTGVHVHIGSSILEPEPYVRALSSVLEMIDALEREGVRIETLDLGGGFGADYATGDAPPASAFADAIVPLLRARVQRGLKIIMEPGRTIAANAGVLLTRVLFVKFGGGKKFVVCDAGMNTLLRPALYEAFHFVWPASVAPQHEPVRRAEKLDLPGLESCDVVGPVCESGDFLARDRSLPLMARGDLLAVFAAGAYGMSMASRYNSHPLPAEVMVEGNRVTLIRQRETIGDLVAHELRAEGTLGDRR
jgi:diaminopimelate decarboxylase